MKKEERNCGSSYPVYPNVYSGGGMMPGPLPISGVNMPMPMPIGTPTPYTNVSFDSVSYGNNNSLSNQIASLEQRITNLENMLGNSSYSSTSYNTTNYQMM